MINPIRNAIPEDAVGIAALLQSIGWFKAINQLSEEEGKRKIERDLNMCLSEPESHSIYISEGLQGNIEGYVSVHWLPYMILAAPEGYISELFVLPSKQGQGIGQALLDFVKEEAHARGCYRLSLLNVKTRESYQRQFYAKHGWIERTDIANFIFPID